MSTVASTDDATRSPEDGEYENVSYHHAADGKTTAHVSGRHRQKKEPCSSKNYQGKKWKQRRSQGSRFLPCAAHRGLGGELLVRVVGNARGGLSNKWKRRLIRQPT